MKKLITVTAIYDGFDPDFDERLENAVGRGSSGSGFGGERDICWDYRIKKAAERAANKLKRFKRVTKVNICVTDEDSDVWEPLESYDIK